MSGNGRTLPRVYRFGPGHEIRLVYLSHARYLEEAEEEGTPTEEQTYGYFDRDDLIIYIDKSYGADRVWKTIRHELLHYLTDMVDRG